jgi:hypothetical protein
VAWSNSLPAGCTDEVFVRAGDNRQALANEGFVAVTNGASLVSVQGRYIEVRYGMTRTNATQQPTLSDLTLYGSSTSYHGDLFLEGGWAHETGTAWFLADVVGPEPLTYRWSVMYPWTNQFALLTGETNWCLAWTNADQWENGSLVTLSVSNAAGETVSLGSVLSVYPLAIDIPGSPTNTSGPAERYPATINVRGEPTNGLSRVEVTLHNLRHAYPADLDILLVSPSGAKIMLMSDAGGGTGVTNATLVFHPNWQNFQTPPDQGAILSNQKSHLSSWNYGDQETQLPGAPAGPYSALLDNVPDTDPNPNGLWELYIYDDKTGQTGVLQESWSMQFFY